MRALNVLPRGFQVSQTYMRIQTRAHTYCGQTHACATHESFRRCSSVVLCSSSWSFLTKLLQNLLHPACKSSLTACSSYSAACSSCFNDTAFVESKLSYRWGNIRKRRTLWTWKYFSHRNKTFKLLAGGSIKRWRNTPIHRAFDGWVTGATIAKVQCSGPPFFWRDAQL